MPDHEHQWKMVIHMDGCHVHTSSYACKCGAARTITAERDFKKDPWAGVWALAECDRCKELLAGARRKPRSDTITLPDHSVIKNGRLLKAKWK